MNVEADKLKTKVLIAMRIYFMKTSKELPYVEDKVACKNYSSSCIACFSKMPNDSVLSSSLYNICTLKSLLP